MEPTSTPSPNAAQIDNWNAAAGQTWVRFQTELDRQVEPLGARAIAALALRRGESVLDIGCGCGQTTLELAARVGPGGRVVGVDVSAPMLGVARLRLRPDAAAAIEFRQLDAQTADLGSAAFDAVFSRFGVMFFADAVEAFRNVLRSLKPGGRLAFVCWRSLQENTWMRVPLEAARALLPAATPADPHAPGPFAFADADRVRSILLAAGFTAVSATPYDHEVGGGTLEEALDLALRVGPLGATLRERPELLPSLVVPVREAIRPFLTASGVWMPGATWIIEGRRS